MTTNDICITIGVLTFALGDESGDIDILMRDGMSIRLNIRTLKWLVEKIEDADDERVREQIRLNKKASK